MAVCTKTTAAAAGLPYYGLCAQAGQSVYCPCVSLTASESCSSLTCASSPTSGSCHIFPASSMGSCMCVDELKTLVSKLSSSGKPALEQLSDLENDICGSFYINYSTSLVLTYVAALTSVIISMILQYAMKKLTLHENHNSLGQSVICQSFFISSCYILLFISNPFIHTYTLTD